MKIRRILFWTDFNEHIDQRFDNLAGRIRQILNPTGLSDIAKVALQQACQLADEFAAELHVLYVVNDLSKLEPNVSAQLSEGCPDARDTIVRAEQILAEIPVLKWSEGRTVVRKVRVGQVSHEITTYVIEQNIDLLVVGAHGYTAEKVTRTAGCPVWSVPSKQARAAALVLRGSASSRERLLGQPCESLG